MKPFTFFSLILFFLISCGNDSPKKDNSDIENKDTQALAIDNPAPSEDPIAESPTLETINPEKIKPEVPKAQKINEVAAKKDKQKEVPETEPVPTPAQSSPQEPIVKDSPVEKKKEIEKKSTDTKPVEPKQQEQIKEQMKPDLYNHEIWNQLMTEFVSSNGKVNYKALKREQSKLETYLTSLENTTVENSWPKTRKMAFWINAYNAYTIKLILDNYPVSSITKLEGGKPWDKKWIKLNGKTLSLNNIENDIIRPQFKDARIHFAVNCAAKSCPPLLNRAWTENNLESYLDKQAKAFVNNPSYNKISENAIEVSKIFDWYGEDFGNLIDYLNKYSKTQINKKAKIGFKEYDWALNE